MAWKPTGRPTVRQQRAKWVVRVDGIDTETGQHRPRQLGMDPAVALPAVFLYRLATFWLPILPGWACFTWLKRADYI